MHKQSVALTQWSGSLGRKYTMRNAHSGRSGAIPRLKREAKQPHQVSMAEFINAAGTCDLIVTKTLRRVKA